MGKSRKSGPTVRDLQLFHDLFSLLRSGNTVAQVVEQLQAIGWRVDATLLYKKLSELEDVTRPAGHRGEWLFVKRTRGSRRSEPTDAGRAFDVQVGRLLRLYEDVFSRKGGGQSVCVGATNAINTYVLPAALGAGDYLARQQLRELRLFEGEWWEILNELRAGRVDFGLGPAVPSSPQYETSFLTEFRRVLICHPAHRFAQWPADKPFDLRALATETVLVLPEGVQPAFPFELLPEPKPPRGKRLVVRQFAQMHAWAAQGLGVGLSLDLSTTRDLRRNRVAQPISMIELSDQLGSTPAYLYFRPGGADALSAEASALVTCIREAFAPQDEQ